MLSVAHWNCKIKRPSCRSVSVSVYILETQSTLTAITSGSPSTRPPALLQPPEMATGQGFDLGSDRTVELKGLAGSHRLTQLVGGPDRNTRP